MAKRKYTVYSHRNVINGKVYVGMTSQTLSQRWGRNGSRYKKQNAFWDDICKFGWDNFDHIVHASGIPQWKAKKMEIDLIEKFNSADPQYGYNKTKGGEIGTLGSVGPYKDCFGYNHPCSVRVYCPELDEEFGSMNQAALFAGVTSGAISLCLSGKSKTAGTHFQTGERLHWMYVNK